MIQSPAWVKVVPMSVTESPVTQIADVAVKNASMIERSLCSEKGHLRRTVPRTMRKA